MTIHFTNSTSRPIRILSHQYNVDNKANINRIIASHMTLKVVKV